MNYNIVSIVLFLTLLLTNKVSSYVINTTSGSIPLDLDDREFLENIKNNYGIEKVCVESGGVFENGNCIDSERKANPPSSKSFSNAKRVCSDYGLQYSNGACVTPKATMAPQVSTTTKKIETTMAVNEFDEDEFMNSFKDFERVCLEIGGVFDAEEGNCYNPNIQTVKTYIPTSKTIPYEYHDIHWRLKQYPKTLTNFESICNELGGVYETDIGRCREPSPTNDIPYSTIEPIPFTSNPEMPVCAGAWDQCGGDGYQGPTCCPDGFKCITFSNYYSQCVRTI
jgi:hypothetical protein